MQTGKAVTSGVVLRVTDTKETDRILTVLTPDRGKIPLIARGARRKNSRLAAACQMPAYSELTIYKRGGWYLLDEASPIELFDRLGRDIEKFMGTKVFLQAWVKVKENWRDNPNFIRSQGYNED